jgi:uncharacterized SAM-binding protein YcdF (DUF218 family)
MFFYLSKLLAFAISPLVWVFALLLWALLTRREDRRKKLLIWGLAVFYFFGNPFVVDECFRQWEPVTPDVDLGSENYDAAIVLGGIGSVDMRLEKINFGYSCDRLFQALPLYYKGRVKRIIFTGGSGSIEFPEKKEGVYVAKYLQSIHFPDSGFIIEPHSRNTFENAVFTKKITDSLGVKNVLLITSAFHMRRSLAIFEKAGYKNITPYATNRVSGARRFTPDHLLLPNAEAFLSVQLLIHEWIGYLTYKLRGYA